MDEIARLFDTQGLRKFLLEMATGTGKTLLCAALIRRFLMSRNAERVLFIVDRIELARQTIEDFAVVLPEFKPVIYKTARRTGELLGASVVVATIQSLMTDRRYREEFTPFYFDLVINDEAHRSIYGDAREVVQLFQATRIGLTATPKAYLKNINMEQLAEENPQALEARQLRDTYHYFGCKPGFPTYRYDIIDAVKDPEGPFLCLPKIFDLRSDITTKALAESGWAVVVSEQEESFKIQDLEKKIMGIPLTHVGDADIFLPWKMQARPRASITRARSMKWTTGFGPRPSAATISDACAGQTDSLVSVVGLLGSLG